MRGAILDCGERVPGYKVRSPNFSGLLAGEVLYYPNRPSVIGMAGLGKGE